MRHGAVSPSTFIQTTNPRRALLTKQGNKWLRWTFVEAVSPAIRVSPRLRRYYDGVKQRHGTKAARAATARKLVELTRAVWTQRRCYEKR